jgi:magnesium transporter
MHIKPLKSTPGAEPGLEHDEITSLPSAAGKSAITCSDYAPGNVVVQEITDLEGFLGGHRPNWCTVRWISVVGLSDLRAIQALATKYDLHPLALEDLLHVSQRPKIESYGGGDSDIRARMFFVARALRIKDGSLQHEQISIFLGHSTVLSFEETPSELWAPIHHRLKVKGSRLRSNDASFLAYSLLDAIVDSCFPILEYYGDKAEELETRILEQAQRSTINDIHQLKRDLLLLRSVVWPLREVVSTLQRESHECLSETTHVYLRDLYDHVIQIIDIIETYREMASDLTETYMSSISNRMNEVMKVLTIIGTIFIPLTFLAGVYGMNFHYFPELNQVWAYPAFWVICILLATTMLLMFRRRNWL